MKKLPLLVIAAALIGVGATVTIQFYSQQAHIASLNDADIGLVERLSPHGYGWFTMSELKTYVAAGVGGSLQISYTAITNPIPNASLANSSVTINGTANHITTTSATIALGGSSTLDVGTSIALRDAANAFTASNHFAGAVTTSTNSCNGIPDLSVIESDFSTNNAIVFGPPIGTDTTGKTVQWLLINAINTSGVAVPITAQGSVNVVGTPYCTNLTWGWYQCKAGVRTNLALVPVF